MRIIEDTPSAMPDINPEKVCFVVTKARELLSEDEGLKPDASNAADDGEQSILTDAAYGPIRAELEQFLDLVAGLAVARLDREHRPIDRLDRSAHANRRRLLGKAR